MRKITVSLLLGGLLSCLAPAAAEPRSAAVLPADAEMRLDGVLDEPCWKKADWQKQFASQSGAVQPTSFAVLKDGNGLWFGFKAVDREILSKKREPDGPLWSDDCLEIFLMPEHAVPEDPNAREFFHFIFNPDGCRYDARNFGGVGDTRWNSRWRAAVKRTADGFHAEVFIPYAGLTLHPGETDWRLNVGREDHVEKVNRLSSWVPCRTFNECTAFGVLKNAAPDWERFQIVPVESSIRIDGSGDTPRPVLDAAFRTAPRRELTFSAVLRTSDGKVRGMGNASRRSGDDGKVSVSLPLAATESGDYDIELYASDRAGTIYGSNFRRRIDIAPLTFRWRNPVYRSALFASQPDRSIAFAVTLRSAKPLTVSAQLRDASGKELASEIRENVSGEADFHFSAATLAPGDYTVAVKADGKEYLEHFTVLAPQPGNEVVLTPDRKLMVNGKPFFPRGFIGGGTDLAPHLAAKLNVIHFYELHRQDIAAIKALLDRCDAAGLKVIMTPAYRTNLGFWGVKKGGKYTPKFSDENIRDLKFMVNELKSHPALLAWYLYDEPRGAAWTAELKRLYDLCREIDPGHPVIGLDNSVSGCLDKHDHCDIALLDIYANPFVQGGPARPVAMIASSTASVINGLPPDKGFWQCPQAYDNDSFQKPDAVRERRAPTYTESRATVFGCLAAGANGVIPYKIGNPACRYFQRHGNAGVFADPELKIGYLEGIMPELAALTPVLLSPEFPVDFNGAVRVRGYRFGNHRFVIAANVETVPKRLELRLPGADNLRVLGEKRTVASAGDGLFRDDFAPLAVHIYTDSPDFPETTDVAAVAAKIAAEREAALRELKK